MKITAHPEFGKELRRPFNMAEECYDCAEFYDGCGAWPASKAFACGMVNRLPDVMSGTCGQMLPPSRVSGSNSVHTDAVFEIVKPKAATRWAPASLNRLCGGGGAVLPKRKRLCDQCRI